MSSEVARIRAQIEAEIASLNLLIGAPAIVASHRIIEHKYSYLDRLGNELSEVVGKEEADKFITNMYMERMQGRGE